MLTELALDRGVLVPVVPFVEPFTPRLAADVCLRPEAETGTAPSSAVVMATDAPLPLPLPLLLPPSSLSVTDSISEPDEPEVVVEVEGRRASVAGVVVAGVEAATFTVAVAAAADRLAPRIFLYFASSLSASV